MNIIEIERIRDIDKLERVLIDFFREKYKEFKNFVKLEDLKDLKREVDFIFNIVKDRDLEPLYYRSLIKSLNTDSELYIRLFNFEFRFKDEKRFFEEVSKDNMSYRQLNRSDITFFNFLIFDYNIAQKYLDETKDLFRKKFNKDFVEIEKFVEFFFSNPGFLQKTAFIKLKDLLYIKDRKNLYKKVHEFILTDMSIKTLFNSNNIDSKEKLFRFVENNIDNNEYDSNLRATHLSFVIYFYKNYIEEFFDEVESEIPNGLISKVVIDKIKNIKSNSFKERNKIF